MTGNVLRMGVQPGNRETAPGQLGLVQSFVNSVNVEFGPDRFGTVDGLALWLSRHKLLDNPAEIGESERNEAVALREALRGLLRENTGADPDPAARRAVNEVAARCPLMLEYSGTGDRMSWRPAVPGTRGAFAQILAAMVETQADGSWTRLKACAEHRCEWVFYDRSRNRSSRWCSMAVCGSRAKMQSYRQHQRHLVGG